MEEQDHNRDPEARYQSGTKGNQGQSTAGFRQRSYVVAETWDVPPLQKDPAGQRGRPWYLRVVEWRIGYLNESSARLPR
jgi:hypothetical protein